MTDCGGNESCCTSLVVPGGAYARTYTNHGDGGTDAADPATVSTFRLDKYEVTVGRFRRFVSAVLDGSWTNTVTAGSGRHTHLNGGQGLVAAGGGFESGWSTSYDGDVAPATYLDCDTAATWTPSPGSNEDLPIDCVDWYEAYAFCIWDGGFLPSEAEWEYAAAGGGELREYPWGSAAPGTACPGTGCSYATYGCYYPTGPGPCSGTTANIADVGTTSAGAGLWGQLDLAGNMWEWNLDSFASSYSNPCADCAYLTAAPRRVIRGGSYDDSWPYLLPPSRYSGATPTNRLPDIGFRCARTP